MSRLSLSAAALALVAAAFPYPVRPVAAAPACPDPDALGTAREITVGGESVPLGLKTYPQTLALADHEVVLTFDDGPLPSTTPRVLDALAAQCVKATFFLIGRNAAAAPALARREFTDGHSVGHHSFSHPAVTLRGLSDEAALADIDKGMAADDVAVYGETQAAPRVPFFRFPGFADTAFLRDALKRRHIAIFGADLWASDWVPMTPDAELNLVMARLDTTGRGILLLHDAREQTAAMLPRLLLALKAKGYRIVHIVPGADPAPTRPAAGGWTSETERIIAHVWPKIQRPRSARAVGLKGPQP